MYAKSLFVGYDALPQAGLDDVLDADDVAGVAVRRVRHVIVSVESLHPVGPPVSRSRSLAGVSPGQLSRPTAWSRGQHLLLSQERKEGLVNMITGVSDKR